MYIIRCFLAFGFPGRAACEEDNSNFFVRFPPRHGPSGFGSAPGLMKRLLSGALSGGFEGRPDLRLGVWCCGACARPDRRSDDAAGAARSGPFSLPRKSGCSPQACGPVFCVGVRLRKVGAPWAAGRMCGGRIGTRPARFVVFLCRGTGRRLHRAVGGPFAGRLREGRGEYIRGRCRIRLRLSFGLLHFRGGAAVRKHGFRLRGCSVCRAVCSRGHASSRPVDAHMRKEGVPFGGLPPFASSVRKYAVVPQVGAPRRQSVPVAFAGTRSAVGRPN